MSYPSWVDKDTKERVTTEAQLGRAAMSYHSRVVETEILDVERDEDSFYAICRPYMIIDKEESDVDRI